MKQKARMFMFLFGLLLAACRAGPSGPAVSQAPPATPPPSTPQRTPQPTLVPEELELNQEHVRFTDILSSEAQVRVAGPLPDVPLVVIRHGIAFDGPPDWPTEAVERLWTELQTDLAGRTAHGKLILARRSHHRIQEDQPQIASAAIREVVDAAMQNAKCKMQNAKCKMQNVMRKT